MEAAIFTLVFLLSLVAYVALHVRAGLAEDADWSRQQLLVGHGLRLGLPARDSAAARRPAAVAPPETGWAARGAAAAVSPRPESGQVRPPWQGAPGPAILAGGVAGAQPG